MCLQTHKEVLAGISLRLFLHIVQLSWHLLYADRCHHQLVSGSVMNFALGDAQSLSHLSGSESPFVHIQIIHLGDVFGR